MISTLPGFREFYPSDCKVRNAIFEKWRSVGESFGFEEYDSPVLEPLELFTKKSGDEIVSQLFSFEDRGGRAVALRPEMTPSLARLVGAKANALKKPIKWFSIGENFRYERPQKGRLRSFFQFNADIIGESSVCADAEIIALAIESFSRFGLSKEDFYVRLSDRKIWTLWIEAWGAGKDLQAILEILDKWERTTVDVKLSSLSSILKERAEEFLNAVEELRSCKTVEAIKNSFSKISSSEEIDSRLIELEELLKELEFLGCSKSVEIDLGIVRGLAYYTGFVFEVFTRGDGVERALAGGGRYDDLLGKLSSVAMPAVGFAAGDVTLLEFLKSKDKLPSYSKDKCFMVADQSIRHELLKDVLQLRSSGLSVSYSLSNNSVSKQMKNADKAGASWVIFYGEDELKSDKVLLKNLKSREEQVISRNDLVTFFNARI